MVRGADNPPRLIIEIAGREPFVIWDESDARRFMNETLVAMWVWPSYAKAMNGDKTNA